MAVTLSSDKDIELIIMLSKLAVSLSVMAFIISLIFLLKIVNLEKQLKGKLGRSTKLERFSSPKTEFYSPPTEQRIPVNQLSQFHTQNFDREVERYPLKRTIAAQNWSRSNHPRKGNRRKDKYITFFLITIALFLICTVVVFQLGDVFGKGDYPLYLWLIVGFVMLAIATVSEELFLK
ncbi:hypothetical protein V2H45_12205 [Tumidithrix elongata RA019]|uniref:Uncharacterized protein n=1 Tax=Tumidithrix elongata BACA0141 TaxID=2716417 RepID=A0AAW9PSS1_9CYAN|nr:hypothetical protein [Tumidithrix elongata RA019]